MLNYGLAGRSQNILFSLYLIDTNIEYKKIDIFYSDPLRARSETRFGSVWIPRYPAFAYMFGFQKIQKTRELWCLVVWSALGLSYYTN